MEAMAYDPQSGILYGRSMELYHGESCHRGAARVASRPGGDVEGLAALDGKIYGLNSGANTLQYYDPGTNTWTTVGGIGFDIDNVGLASDPLRKLLYFKATLPPTSTGSIRPRLRATLIGSTGITEGEGWASSVCLRVPMCRSPGRETSEVGAGVINATGCGTDGPDQGKRSPQVRFLRGQPFKLTALDEEDILKASAFASRITPTYTFNGTNVTAENPRRHLADGDSESLRVSHPHGAIPFQKPEGKSGVAATLGDVVFEPGCLGYGGGPCRGPAPKAPRVPEPTRPPVPQPTRPAPPRVPLNP